MGPLLMKRLCRPISKGNYHGSDAVSRYENELEHSRKGGHAFYAWSKDIMILFYIYIYACVLCTDEDPVKGALSLAD